jgi:hypothetical protein
MLPIGFRPGKDWHTFPSWSDILLTRIRGIFFNHRFAFLEGMVETDEILITMPFPKSPESAILMDSAGLAML